MSSPPPAYAFLRIPTVQSLHPLWDDHDEFSDPQGLRVLANGRETLSTTPIDAWPEGITKGEQETLLPLTLAITIAATLAVLIARDLWAAIALTGVCVVQAAVWMWPEGRA
jgi:hypothetical protein